MAEQRIDMDAIRALLAADDRTLMLLDMAAAYRRDVPALLAMLEDAIHLMASDSPGDRPEYPTAGDLRDAVVRIMDEQYEEVVKERNDLQRRLSEAEEARQSAEENASAFASDLQATKRQLAEAELNARTAKRHWDCLFKGQNAASLVLAQAFGIENPLPDHWPQGFDPERLVVLTQRLADEHAELRRQLAESQATVEILGRAYEEARDGSIQVREANTTLQEQVAELEGRLKVADEYAVTLLERVARANGERDFEADRLSKLTVELDKTVDQLTESQAQVAAMRSLIARADGYISMTQEWTTYQAEGWCRDARAALANPTGQAAADVLTTSLALQPEDTPETIDRDGPHYFTWAAWKPFVRAVAAYRKERDDG